MTPTTNREIAAGLEVIMAVAEAIRVAEQIPAGTLYAMLMGKLTLEQFNKIITTLKNTGLVVEDQSHLLRWVEPCNTQPTKPTI